MLAERSHPPSSLSQVLEGVTSTLEDEARRRRLAALRDWQSVDAGGPDQPLAATLAGTANAPPPREGGGGAQWETAAADEEAEEEEDASDGGEGGSDNASTSEEDDMEAFDEEYSEDERDSEGEGGEAGGASDGGGDSAESSTRGVPVAFVAHPSCVVNDAALEAALMASFDPATATVASTASADGVAAADNTAPSGGVIPSARVNARLQQMFAAIAGTAGTAGAVTGAGAAARTVVVDTDAGADEADEKGAAAPAASSAGFVAVPPRRKW